MSQIVEAHNGQISTDTWRGKTRFLVILPLNAKKPDEKNEKSVQALNEKDDQSTQS